ncbi:hypothetical protein TNCT_674681 [Trichonephila clavata]|uniref:Uncharacterized protein n=1 Tax=Trichonephila clavata TaxID=2740835 RepID=A0A8X6KP17_TRICU|nr:hypothetical protein TNCT_674681 [Trichonephila clavata]
MMMDHLLLQKQLSFYREGYSLDFGNFLRELQAILVVETLAYSVTNLECFNVACSQCSNRIHVCPIPECPCQQTTSP